MLGTHRVWCTLFTMRTGGGTFILELPPSKTDAVTPLKVKILGGGTPLRKTGTPEFLSFFTRCRYFDSIFDSIKDAGEEGPQCPICLGESVSLAFPDCGHFVCSHCMARWLGQAGHGGPGAGAPCPTCRKDLNSSNIVYFVVRTRLERGLASASSRSRRCGYHGTARAGYFGDFLVILDGCFVCENLV